MKTIQIPYYTSSLDLHVEEANLEAVIKMAKAAFKYVLVDVPPGFNPTSIAAAEMSNCTYVVAMLNGGYEIKHVQRSLDVFEAWDDFEDRVRVVFTRVKKQ